MVTLADAGALGLVAEGLNLPACPNPGFELMNGRSSGPVQRHNAFFDCASHVSEVIRTMAFEESKIRTVIEVLHDGERGFKSLSEHLKEPRLKTYFAEEGTHRAQFAAELEAALSTISDKQEKEGGTVAGTLHRKWAEVKGSLGGSDHTLLETAEQGEDAAKKAYSEALQTDELPASIRAILQKQQPHIIASHDKVRGFRDSIAA